MRESEPPFEIENGGVYIKVSEHEIAGERVFHLEFPDKRKPHNTTVGGIRSKERGLCARVFENAGRGPSNVRIV
jgi:hypothetical protein